MHLKKRVRVGPDPIALYVLDFGNRSELRRGAGFAELGWTKLQRIGRWSLGIADS